MSLRVESRESGARALRAVTPNDGADLSAGIAHSLWVGGAGNISVVAADDPTGSPVLISGIPAGTQLHIRAKRVMATNTTATLIVAYY